MTANPVPAWLYLWMVKKQKANAVVMDTTAELTASKVIEKRRSCRPQIVQTKNFKPSKTLATTFAIFFFFFLFYLRKKPKES